MSDTGQTIMGLINILLICGFFGFPVMFFNLGYAAGERAGYAAGKRAGKEQN